MTHSPTLSDARDVRAEDAFDVAALSAWLSAELGDSSLAAHPQVRQFSGGASNLTYLLQYPDRELILRRPPGGHRADGAHDIATTPHDYRALGTNCIGVLEALSRTVYDPATHLRDGEDPQPVDKTKIRIGRFIEDAAAEPHNAGIRGLVNKASEMAHSVEHSTSTRRDAGVAADAVILLANMLRRLYDEPEQSAR